MDQSFAVFDDKTRNEAKASFLRYIITGLESKRMTLVEMKASANFILDHIDNIKNYSEFMVFLDELKNKWTIFTDVYGLYNNKFYQEKEKLVIDKLSKFIKSQV